MPKYYDSFGERFPVEQCGASDSEMIKLVRKAVIERRPHDPGLQTSCIA